MPSWVDHKGLQLPDPDPAGDAGANLKENFIILADRGIDPDSTLVCVVFVGGTTGDAKLEVDDTDFVWDATNKRLGIGTDSPTKDLEVVGDGLFEKVEASVNFVADGTNGITQTVIIEDNNGNTHTLNFKYGILTSYSVI